MTKDQMVEMYSMRLDGHSLQEIGNKFGITRQRVQRIVGNYSADQRRAASYRTGLKRVIYPAIRNWILDHEMNLNQFCMGVSDSSGLSPDTIRSAMTRGQKAGPRLFTVRAILNYTGLKFEQAFEEENDGQAASDSH